VISGTLVDHDAAEHTAYAVSVQQVGSLELPAGLFVAGDPYLIGSDPSPFAQTLPTAQPDVLAIRAEIGPGHNRIAALVLMCSNAPIASWSMATAAEEDLDSLEDEGYFGYPVDAGTGSFGNPEAMGTAHRVLAADAGMLNDPISTALMADGIGTESAACVAPEDGAEAIAVCSSGWGDGSYPTWLGLSSDSTVVLAVTDFLLTGDPFAKPLAPTAPAPQTASAPPVPMEGRRPFLKRIFGR